MLGLELEDRILQLAAERFALLGRQVVACFELAVNVGGDRQQRLPRGVVEGVGARKVQPASVWRASSTRFLSIARVPILGKRKGELRAAPTAALSSLYDINESVQVRQRG